MMLSLTFLGMIGGPQIILIIAVVLLLFGGRKIPELMKGLGSGIKEFKNATKEEEEKPKVEEEKKA
ncbi:twin-arginine translocase TatA/TatE family subunit [Flavobacteriaceae bacterium]|jgi:sec-independent protein translocase protein TatA|nr:twin-arginine translocase TatA/TatE family subunit [Flavobacteriaceae bacterium]MDC0515426.1 twin-arginine translocase TatA/TatE family subunit [Flavobacteriaceae bacterium]OUU19803.1 MAG: twin-arginine translocase TatA/TatE family subunit [Flavobacteriaceae bacterium TMED48]CAI8361078.1 MAG: Sec-independent protein translocase protein TatAy [uncultured Bacteroidetes bacterium]|tara:strand:+ start:976 stop:1173 length:198 start_codon:yes stop_codon:yes gene_type:complete